MAALARGGHHIGVVAGDVGDVIVLGDGLGGAYSGNQAFGVEVDGRDGGLTGASLADLERQRAGIDVLDGDDATLRQEFGK